MLNSYSICDDNSCVSIFEPPRLKIFPGGAPQADPHGVARCPPLGNPGSAPAVCNKMLTYWLIESGHVLEIIFPLFHELQTILPLL